MLKSKFKLVMDNIEELLSNYSIVSNYETI